MSLIKIYTIDSNFPCPRRQTKGAIGFDLYSRIDMKIKSREHALIPLNVVIEVDRRIIPLIFPRSSLFKRYGLIVTNSIGLIDWDYKGKDDELMLSVYNLKDKDSIIYKGSRVAQLVFVSTLDLDMNDIEYLPISKNKNDIRGGFGSTGK